MEAVLRSAGTAGGNDGGIQLAVHGQQQHQQQGHHQQQVLVLPPSTSTTTNSETIDFISLSSCTTHPSNRLYWVNVADIAGVAPPRDPTTGEGGRYWPSLVYEGGYEEAMKEVDKSQKQFLAILLKARNHERTRNKFLAASKGGGDTTAPPPPPRPIFILLGIQPLRASPLPDTIATLQQAEAQGIIHDFYGSYDNFSDLRGFNNIQTLQAAIEHGYDDANNEQGRNQFDIAFQIADSIVSHSVEQQHTETVARYGPNLAHGTLFDNMVLNRAAAGAQMPMALPPSTTTNARTGTGTAAATGSAASASSANSTNVATTRTTNHINAVSTMSRGPPTNRGSQQQQPFVSPVPFAPKGLGLPNMMVGPTEEQARALAASLGGGDGAASSTSPDAAAEEEDHQPSHPGRVSISPQQGNSLEGAAVEAAAAGSSATSAVEEGKDQEQDQEGEKDANEDSDDDEDKSGDEEDGDIQPTATPAKADKSSIGADVDAESPPDNAKSPIWRKDPWVDVWPKLKASGWTYKGPTGIERDWTYIKPGKKIATGVAGVDYFRSERAVKEYIRDTYGWRGIEGDLTDEVDINDMGRGRRARVESKAVELDETTAKSTAKKKKGGKPKSGAKQSAKKTKMNKGAPSSARKPAKSGPVAAITPAPKNEASDPPEIIGTPIAATDEWLDVWSKLEYTGWRRKIGSGLMMDYYYILPDRQVKGGVEGVDYLTSEDAVREYCEKNYGWDRQAAERVRMEEKAEAERKAKAAAAEAKRKAKKATAEEKRKGAAKKQASAGSKRKSEATSDAKSASRTKHARQKEKDHDQYHQEPGKRSTKSSPGRVWGKEPTSPQKKSSEEVAALPSTPTSVAKTKPQDPAKPRLSDSPVSGGSLTPDDKGFYDWANLWPRLKRAGWTYRKGPGLVSWIYVRPNRNPSDKNTQMGVDYFASEQDVIKYCKQSDIEEGEVAEVAGAKSSKKRSSPAKNEQSAVTGDFDMEAIKSPPASSSTSNGKKRAKSSSNKKRKVESVWWRTHPVPSSVKSAWPILKNKLGFRYISGTYKMPNCPKKGAGATFNFDYFEDLEELRKLLCKTGIPNLSSSELTEDDRDIVTRWVATANTPLAIQEDTSVDVLKRVPIYSDKDAWTLLKFKLGWDKTDESGETRYYEPKDQSDPNSSRGQVSFMSIGEVQDYLRCQGPFDKRYNYKWAGIKTPNKSKGRELPADLAPEEYLALTFWAARSPLPVYGDEDQEPTNGTDDATGEQKPSAPSTAESPSAASSASSSSSPSSTFGPYEGGDQEPMSEDHDESARSSSGGIFSTVGSTINNLCSSVFNGCSKETTDIPEAHATPVKERGRPFEDMVDEHAPATPDERIRKERIIKDSQEKMRSLSCTPAKASDDWAQFWNKMKLAGWELRSEDGVSKEVYYPPEGKEIKYGGDKGIDYFTSVEEVRQYAVDHLGWGGKYEGIQPDDVDKYDDTKVNAATTPAPEAEVQELEISMATPGLTYKQSLINRAKENMRAINGTPVQHEDDWLNVKEKMKHSGWNFWCTGPKLKGNQIVDFVWLLPGGKKPSKGGESGVDYLMNEEEAKQFAKDHFDWCGIFEGINQIKK